MVDNSISMGMKQELLANSVPFLLRRLTDPSCVDADGRPTSETVSSGCPGSTRPEFDPIRDIHVGVITSSLGSHGGEVCVDDPAEMPPRTLNDGAQLLPSVRVPAPYSFQNYGFLVWDPREPRPAPDPHPGVGMNETELAYLTNDLVSHVVSPGERGCGYEASLEAWYRFLIDPEPIREVATDGQVSVRGPINPVVLEQRARFLRPDSVLAIVMLTDENDCSIIDENGTQGWLVGRHAAMPRGSDACAHPEDPNLFRCCVPCVLLENPGFVPQQGCNYDDEVACASGSTLEAPEDSMNLRCYQQVRRFGVDLLYPSERYSDALRARRIALREPDANGNVEVANPIYAPGLDGTPARGPERVFLVGIVGVPWQDIATGPSLTGRRLEYLTAAEMLNPPAGTPSGNRWDVILGDPNAGRPPSDPFMIESVGVRSGENPITGESILPPTSDRGLNNINGHEQDIVYGDDLQYACTYDLIPDIACHSANQDGCDCNESERPYLRPTCQYPAVGDGTMTHDKAHPSLRQLEVLKDFGENAVVASVCPKNLPALGDPASDPDFAYNPAFAAMVKRFRHALAPQCLPQALPTSAAGELSCRVVEARRTGAAACSCDLPGRTELADEAIVASVRSELGASSLCGGSTGVACSDYCLCEIDALEGEELATCQDTLDVPGTSNGFCYVDPASGYGNPELVADCPVSQRRVIRFLGEDLPAPNALAFVACGG
jgi:hypothetical protein